MDRNLPSNLDPAEARWTQAALPEHNARFLPANASYARWISCPWAQFSLGFISHSTLVSSIGARRAPAPSACALRMQTGRRQRRFVVGAGLGLLLGATTDVLRPMPADAGVGAAVSMKDIMDQQEAARKAAKEAEQAKWANRPTELRDNESCLMWNGQKYCTSCVKGCEESKKTFKDIDCIKYCTVEYGAPKPTDEESISFKEFVDGVNKGDVTRVDFFGPNGDKAYATYKVPQGDLGTYIRVGEGFPIEVGNEQSSPLQVVRLLNQKQLPYKFHVLEGVPVHPSVAYIPCVYLCCLWRCLGPSMFQTLLVLSLTARPLGFVCDTLRCQVQKDGESRGSHWPVGGFLQLPGACLRVTPFIRWAFDASWLMSSGINKPGLVHGDRMASGSQPCESLCCPDNGVSHVTVDNVKTKAAEETFLICNALHIQGGTCSPFTKEHTHRRRGRGRICCCQESA